MESLKNPRVRRNRKTKDYEAIPLNWGGVPEALYVCGHVTEEEFEEACNAAYGDDWKEYKLGEIEHVYGRWSCEYPATNEMKCQMLRIYKDHAQRRFPVTQRDVIIMGRST